MTPVRLRALVKLLLFDMRLLVWFYRS